MWIVLMCFFFRATATGFLLEPDHTSNPTEKNGCLPLGAYLSDKEDLRHQMDKLQRENEQKLDILTSQLQSRLSAFEGKIYENDRNNDTLVELASLERKYQELGVNFTLLQQENKLLRDKFFYQASETIRLQNTTIEMSKKISDLEQLKSINQALDFRAIQTKVHSLEQETSLLTSNQNARNQDFLALYNVTQVTDNLLKKQRNETLVKIFNIESKQNASSFAMQNALSNITTLESKVMDNSKRGSINYLMINNFYCKFFFHNQFYRFVV